MIRHRHRSILLGSGLALVLALCAAPLTAQAAGTGYLAPGYVSADLDGDGSVGKSDVSIAIAAVGASSTDADWASVSAADADGDGKITLQDVAAISQEALYDDGGFQVVEASIVDIQSAMNAGTLTSEQLTQDYLDRIAAYDDTAQPGQAAALSAVITTNPNALSEARALDAERAVSGPRSMLHGVPVIVKDNYNTADMATTAGCLCLSDNLTGTDATVVAKLKAAGAVIIGKANLDEFAFGNTNTQSSTGGHTANVYRQDRSAGGSSGGTASAVSANFAALGLGTDTGGSIRIPSSWAGLVGIRPTVGLTSRYGVVPLALSQDVTGPMAKSVTDAAITLDALAGTDTNDSATSGADAHKPVSYTSYLDPQGLKGKRIGFIATANGSSTVTGTTASSSPAARIVNNAKAAIQAAGGSVVDVSLTYTGDSGSTNEFKHDLNIYLQKFDPAYPSLQALIDRGAADASHRSGVQSTLTSRNTVTESTYQSFMTTHLADRAALQSTLDQLMADNHLDALMVLSASSVTTSSTSGTAGNNNRISAFAGYPAITVPAGYADSSVDSTSGSGIPLGMEFIGGAYDEGGLISIAYAFEQQTKVRTSPTVFGELR